jgi:hypothetical protein
MRSTNIAVLFFLLKSLLPAQDVENTSYTTSTGEKVLRLQFVLPVDRHETWNLLATADGWKRWAAPVVSFDLKVGGLILTNYDRNKTVSDSGTIRLPIINYLEEEMLTLKVILNETFSPKVRREDTNLQEVIQIADAGEGKTKVTSSMIGWGAGPEWDKTYDFFTRGNTWSYEQLTKLFH